MEKKLSNIIIATCIFIAGCTIEYNDSSDEIVKSETIPDSVMKNFNLVKVKNNVPHTEVSSTLAETYDKQNKTIMHNVEFTEYSIKTKEIQTTGKADIVEYYNNSEDAKLSGNLRFYSKKDQIEMIGDSLSWDDSEKKITSDINSSILVIKDDGSTIEGYGFSADIKNSTFSFEKNITGVTP